jgi:hypothetical protein
VKKRKAGKTSKRNQRTREKAMGKGGRPTKERSSNGEKQKNRGKEHKENRGQPATTKEQENKTTK